MESLSEPKFRVDFNEMIERDLILLSQTDFKHDVFGNEVKLEEGLRITAIMEDIDANGKRDNIIARGTVELNMSGASMHCKWNLRINVVGIQYESENTNE